MVHISQADLDVKVNRQADVALNAGRHAATLRRVRALHDEWAASPDPFARHHAQLLGGALDGTGRDWSRGLDYDAIHDHVVDQEDD